MLENAAPQLLKGIHIGKREMIYFRKQVWPLQEVLKSLIKEQSTLIQDASHIFLKDVYDHTIQAIDTIESFRDVLCGMLD